VTKRVNRKRTGRHRGLLLLFLWVVEVLEFNS
jgi:hypothetical protein